MSQILYTSILAIKMHTLTKLHTIASIELQYKINFKPTKTYRRL